MSSGILSNRGDGLVVAATYRPPISVQVSNFKSEVSALLATRDFAGLKTKLTSWLMGWMLPLVHKKLGFAPTSSSALFVAGLVNVTGLVIYFTVAFFILRGTLL